MRVLIRPSPVAADATEAERLARLERYVEHIDRDLSGLSEEIITQAAKVIAEGRRRDAALRQEIDARDTERRIALRSSMRRQAWGAACVLVGVLLGTLGDVLLVDPSANLHAPATGG